MLVAVTIVDVDTVGGAAVDGATGRPRAVAVLEGGREEDVGGFDGGKADNEDEYDDDNDNDAALVDCLAFALRCSCSSCDSRSAGMNDLAFLPPSIRPSDDDDDVDDVDDVDDAVTLATVGGCHEGGGAAGPDPSMLDSCDMSRRDCSVTESRVSAVTPISMVYSARNSSAVGARYSSSSPSRLSSFPLELFLPLSLPAPNSSLSRLLRVSSSVGLLLPLLLLLRVVLSKGR